MQYKAVHGLRCVTRHYNEDNTLAPSCYKCEYCHEWIRPENMKDECPATKQVRDGEFFFKEIDPKIFLQKMTEGDFGDPEKMNFLSNSPKIQEEMGDWEGGTYIIFKGEIVFPGPRKTVVEWKMSQ